MAKVDPNHASREELNRIPNFGDDCVERIIEVREQRGGFKSLGELDQIPGFGDEAIRNLEEHASV